MSAHWLRSLRRILGLTESVSRRRRAGNMPRSRRFEVERLEDRVVPTGANVVASSYFDSAVYEFNPANGALVQTLVAPNSQAVLAGPAGMTVGPDGNLYISSQLSNSIVEYNFGTQQLSTLIDPSVLNAIAGQNGLAATFDPAGLRFGPDGDLYVSLNGGQSSTSGGAVIRLSITSNSSDQLAYAGTATTVATGLVQPTELAFGADAGDTNNLYVSNSVADTVVKITNADGASPTASTFITADSGGLNYPSGLTWGADGKLYVVDLENTSSIAVLRYNADGTFDEVFTPPATQPASTQFQFPSDALFVSGGDLLTADLGPTYPVAFGGPGTSGSLTEFNAGGTFNQVLSSSAFPADPTTGVTNFSPSQLALDVTPPVSLIPSAEPADTVGVACNQTIAAFGGTGPVTLAVTGIENAIPGLTVPTSGTTGIAITGTPSAAGTETFTVTATDSLGNTATTNYSITVNAALTLPATLPAADTHFAYNQTVTATGGTGAVTLAVTNISNPIPGLTIPASGTTSIAIIGTPTATGTETFTVTATDALGATTTRNYSITVNPPLVASSEFDSALYEFDVSTGALLSTLVAPYSSTLLANPAGLTIGPDGNIFLASQSSNSIVEYNFSTQTLSTFIPSSVLAPIAAANGDSAFAPSGLVFGPDGNLYVSLNGGIGATSGGAVVRFTITSNGSDRLAFAGTNTTIATGLVQPTELAFGVGSDEHSLYVSNSGSSLSSNYAATPHDVIKIANADGASPSSSVFIATNSSQLNYPSGLTWGPDGKLYVVDLGATSFQGQVVVYNANGSFDAVYTQPASALEFAFPSAAVFDPSGNLVTANLGTSEAPQLTGSIDQFNAAGTFSQTLVSSSQFPDTGVGENGIAPSQLALDVAPPVSLVPAAEPADTVGVAYNQTIAAFGGTGPVTLAVTGVENAIPGLTVPTSGTTGIAITGTPTAPGTETFTVTTTDSTGATTTTSYSITVNPAITLPATLPADTIDVVYNQTITAAGGTGTVTLAVTNFANAIPGLNVPSTGTNSLNITGEPTATGTETFTVTATDSLGATTTTNYSITVNPATHASLPAVQLPGPQSVLDNTTLVFSTATGNAITVSDTGASAGTVETLFLQDFYGTLRVANTAGLSSITGNGTALVTMTGTLTALNAALNGLRYAPPPFTYNFAEPLSATLVAPDNSIASGSTALNVTFASRAPTVPGLQTVLSTGTLTFSSANGNGITVADPVAGSTDVETVYVQTLWGTLHVSTVDANTSISGNDTSLVTLSGPLTQINAALNGLLYTPAAFTYSYSDTLDVLLQAKDGPVTSAVPISVQHVNLAPTATLPSTQAVNSGATLAFSTANGNAISVGDPDANGGIETVTLQATAGSGSLTLHSTVGLTFVSGNGSTLIGLKGTVAQLNAALGQLSFTAAGSFQGTAWLSVLIDDNGSPSALSASGSIAITVSTVVTPPVVTISGPTTEAIVGAGLVAIAPAISVSDPTANGAVATLMVQAMTGSLTVTSTSGLTSVTGVGTKSLTLEGTIAALNTALQSLEYQALTGTTTDFVSVMVTVPNGTATATATLGISLAITPTAVPGG